MGFPPYIVAWLPWQSRQISASMDHPLPKSRGLYGSAAESGIFYRWGMQFRRKVLKPLLVPRGIRGGWGSVWEVSADFFRGKKTGKKCLKQRPKLLENWSGKRIFVCMSQKNIWCHPLVIDCFKCLQYERGMGLYYGIFPLCINNSNHYSNYSVLSCIIHTLYIN